MAVVNPLNAPAAWILPQGGAQPRPIRWAGWLLLASSGCAFLAWMGAVAYDLVRLGASPFGWFMAVTALALSVPWFHVAAGLARSLMRRQAPLTLRWRGLARNQNEDEDQGPPWRLSQWQQEVHVRIVFDWQRWMLLRIQGDRDARNVAWSWLEGASHDLRAQLHHPAANPAPVANRPVGAEGQADKPTAAMASWLGVTFQGSILSRLFPPAAMRSSSAPGAPKRLADHARHAHGELPSSTDFMPTVLMSEIDRGCP